MRGWLAGASIRRSGCLQAAFTPHAASELWLEATVRAACGLAAGQEIAVVAGTAVAVLTRGALAMMLVGRMKIAAAGFMATAAVIVALIGAGSVIAATRQAAQPCCQSIRPARPRRRLDTENHRCHPRCASGPWIKGVVVDTSGKPVGGAQVSSLWTPLPQYVTTKAGRDFCHRRTRKRG